MASKQAKRDWWKTATLFFFIIFILNCIIQFFLALQFNPSSDTSIGASFFGTIFQLTIMGLVPYLYYKNNKWAVPFTIIYLVLIEGIYKINLFLSQSNLFGALFVVGVSGLYLFLAVKADQARK